MEKLEIIVTKLKVTIGALIKIIFPFFGPSK